MLKIENVEVNGIESSIIASGYPLSTNEMPTLNINRAKKLGSVKTGSGHDCFLSGIIVSFDVIYPEYWSPQLQRYNFVKIISSQSKMHRINYFDLHESCNKYVDDRIINILDEFKINYNNAIDPEKKYFWFMKIISNIPGGFEKRMRLVTNYLQLKTIYFQRKNHKLKEDWGNFCNWVEELPMFLELIGVKNESRN